MNNEQTAYQAGLFDGEGSIYMTSRQTNSTITVSFTNTNLELCELFSKTWGGHISSQVPRKMKRAKQVNRWYRHGQNAIPFLEAIFPYLIAKKTIARLALEYLSLRIGSGNSPSPGMLKKRQQISQAIYSSQQRQHLM